MMADTERAERLLTEKDLSCAFCKGNEIYEGRGSGVKPLIEFLNDNKSFNGFCAADKVAGAAAAYLYVLLGVKELYARVMSESAERILKSNGITPFFDILATEICNRKGNGICPMEEAVRNCRSPEEALVKIKERLKELDNLRN